AADDGAVAGMPAMTSEGVVDQRFDLVFAHAGAGRAHRGDVRLGGDFGGASHFANRVVIFDETQLVQSGAQVNDFFGRAHAATLVGADLRDRFQDEVVELSVLAGEVQDFVSPVEQLGQLGSNTIDRKGFVGAKFFDGALDSGATTGPDLTLGIAGPHEQREFFLSIL